MANEIQYGMKTQEVIADILDERVRQIMMERHDIAKDDRYVDGELSLAAACYVTESYRNGHISDLKNALLTGFSGQIWPWSGRWWNPGDRRRNLVRATALIVADIERLDRASTSDATQAQG